MLKQRILTALVLIPITIAILLYLPQPSFYLFTAVIMLAAAWEWSALMGLTNKRSRLLYLLLNAVFLLAALFLPINFMLPTIFIWWVVAAMLVYSYPRSRYLVADVRVRGVMGLLVLVPCWQAINLIRVQHIYALLFLLVIIWGADSAAFFVGRAWGKHKLAPEVSPGKSVEGLLGALVATIVIGIPILWFCQTPYTVWPWAFALMLITVLFSVVGDLFESLMKREANVKDSGSLLPGHGGLLDRIDSLTAAAPVFAFGAWVLGQYLP